MYYLPFLKNIILLLCCSIGISCTSAAVNNQNKNSFVPIPLSESEIQRVHEAVRANLKDPQSAIFGKMSAVIVDEKGTKMICGFVNAKNSFGGYQGNRLYAAWGQIEISQISVFMKTTKNGQIATFQSCKKHNIDI